MNALDEQAKAIIRGFMNDAKVLRHTPSAHASSTRSGLPWRGHLAKSTAASVPAFDPALKGLEELAISAPRVIHWAGPRTCP